MSDTPIGEHLQGHSDSVWSVAFSPDGKRIVSGSSDRTIRFGMPCQVSQLVHLCKGPQIRSAPLHFFPHGTHLVSGSADSTVQIWDVASGAPIREPLQRHSRDVLSVAFSPDGTCIASSSADNTVQIWDAMSGAPIRGIDARHAVRQWMTFRALYNILLPH